MSDFELEQDEKKLGSWTINYVPPDGGKYTGKLLVTDKRLLFDAKFDATLMGTLKEMLVLHGSYGYLSIPKSAISAVEEKSGLFKKKVIVTLDNGQQHVFDYGMLSVKKLATAIRES